MENLDALREELLSAVGGADSLDALEELRVSALGRSRRNIFVESCRDARCSGVMASWCSAVAPFSLRTAR